MEGKWGERTQKNTQTRKEVKTNEKKKHGLNTLHQKMGRTNKPETERKVDPNKVVDHFSAPRYHLR